VFSVFVFVWVFFFGIEIVGGCCLILLLWQIILIENGYARGNYKTCSLFVVLAGLFLGGKTCVFIGQS
jgi:hypothetical protein